MDCSLICSDECENDYSAAENWLYTPPDINKPFDVFYMYPTSWIPRGQDQIVCGIEDPMMKSAAQTVFSVQASAFFPAANIYAPYYRQLSGAFILSMNATETRKYIRCYPLIDCLAAFDYYINNFNSGRPFVLAAHSQGAATVKELLKDYMKSHPEVYRRMIAAYLIGYGITETELSENPHLKFAKGADDTGVIISYNTEPPSVSGENPTAPAGTRVINPLNWRCDETCAPKEANAGSLITGGGQLHIKKHYADAQINLERGTLVCSTVSTSDCFTPPPLGAFHSFDFGFYYVNLRQNVILRSDAFLRLKNMK